MDQLPQEIQSHILSFLSFNDIKNLLLVSKGFSDLIQSVPNSYHTSTMLIHSQNIEAINKSDTLFSSNLCRMRLFINTSAKRETGSQIFMTAADVEIDKDSTNKLLLKLKSGHFGSLWISGFFNGDDKILQQLPEEKIQDYRDPRSFQDDDN